MSNTQKAVRGISSQAIVTLVLGILEIILFSVMSRLLTREDFGYYAAISAITTVFESFSETGIGSALVQKKNVNADYINSAFTMSFAFGLFLTLLLFVLSKPLSSIVVGDYSLSVPLRIMSVTLLCHCLTSVNYSIMYKELKFFKVGTIKLCTFVLTAIVAILMAIRGWGFKAIVAQCVTHSLLALLISYIMVNNRYKFCFNTIIIKDIWQFSGWLMASAVFRNIASQVDKLVMPRMLSLSMLGSYSRPMGLIEKISSKVNSIFDVSLFPVLSRIQDDRDAMQRAFDKIYYFMNIVGMVMFVFFFFNASLIVRIFLGEKWLDLSSLFQIMSFVVIFKVQARLADCMLRSLAMTKMQFNYRVIESITKTTAVAIGAIWGLWGVTISVLLADIFVRISKIIFVAKKVDILPMQLINKMFKSWRFILVMLPPMILIYYVRPIGLHGDLLMIVTTLVIFSIVFVITPSAVGSLYKEIVYENIILKEIKKLSYGKRD